MVVWKLKTPGARIRSIREAQDLSQQEVADRAGISQMLLSQIERDRTVPTVVKAQALAAVLGTTVEELWPLTPRTRALHDEKVSRS